MGQANKSTTGVKVGKAALITIGTPVLYIITAVVTFLALLALLWGVVLFFNFLGLIFGL
jgi:hypothetical protein